MRVGFEAAPMAAATASAVFTGVGVVAIRFVVTEWEPATLAFYRFTIAAVTTLPFLLFSRHARLERHDVVPVSLLGALLLLDDDTPLANEDRWPIGYSSPPARRASHLRAMRRTDSSSVRAPSPSAGTHARACDSSLTVNRSCSA